MNWSDIPWKPSARTLRQFAALWITFFAALAVWQGVAHRRAVVAMVCTVMALTVGPLGLVRPSLIRPIFVAWTVAVFPIGWIVSRLLLAVLFYGLFTPLALAFRLAGRDALCRRRAAGTTTTYWTRRPAPGGVRRYFRQF
jgi:hypothetical protein